MSEINFHITEESMNQMTWEEFEAFERVQEGDVKLFRLRPVLARFMTNGNGTYLEHKKAEKILGSLPMNKIQETIELFMDVVRERAVPKANGNSSKQPSEQSSAVSEFPPGSE